MACKVENRSLTLAECRNLGEITLCGCGTIRVSIGSVTVRLAPDAFCELVVMCRSAADALLLEARAMSDPTALVVH